MSESSLQPASGYSKAFESFVQDDDEEVIGLLAYALYKAHVREAIRSGRPVHLGASRIPTTREVAAFKGEAQTMLSAFARSILEQAKPQIIRDEFGSELDGAKSEILAALSSRTNFWSAVGASIIAWLISIAITVLVVLNGIPPWVLKLAGQQPGS